MSNIVTRRKLSFLVLLFFILSVLQVRAQSSAIETAGDILLFTVPAAVMGTTLLLKDQKGSLQFTEGFLLNQAVTLGLKVAFHKPRPYNNGNNAFPSGHTSTTFQGASFIHKRYGFNYSIPAYLLAGFTAFSRINAQKHDRWDILAGSVVGIGSTLIFTSDYEQEHMALTCTSFEDGLVMGFTFKF